MSCSVFQDKQKEKEKNNILNLNLIASTIISVQVLDQEKDILAWKFLLTQQVEKNNKITNISITKNNINKFLSI